ncbi:MAG: gamma-glutamyltransferase [Bacteroidetes bacterium]|nr:gamma-glutamyltransferase [Bacteroidota bacterium]
MNTLKLRILLISLVFPFILIAQTGNLVQGKNGMAATAHPLASQAAIEMLQKGGNAVDAAIAATFVIGVVEPDGSGIGGGGGMLIYLKDKNQSFYINFYPRAPKNIPANFNSSNDRLTGKSICIPGTVAGLTLAHKEFGSLPLSTLLAPAIRYANDGFAIDATLGSLILDNTEALALNKATASVYLDEGFPRMEGQILIQKDLAKTLTKISKKGYKGFYKGSIAKDMVEGINKGGGNFTLEDFKNYQAELAEPVKGIYRGYEIISAANPQSGVSIIEGLNILENADLSRMGHYTKNAKTLHLLAETFRKIYTDRYYFIADPAFVDVPMKGLLSKEFALERFNAINPLIPVPAKYRDTEIGNPIKYQNIEDTDKNLIDVELNGETTHLCVIDKDGNAVSLTQTLGTFFGAGQIVNGVLFNCAITNFSGANNPNSLQSQKQPRSSIAPSIVLKDNKPFLVIGTPGANRIISTVLEVMVNILDFNMNAEEANTAPRFYTQKFEDYLHVESGVGQDIIDQLTKMGHSLRVYDGVDLFFGGVQLITIDPQTGIYTGSADVRRGGLAIGY